jgi:hypothetical protein
MRHLRGGGGRRAGRVDGGVSVGLLLRGPEHGGSPVPRRSAKDSFASESSAFRPPAAGRVDGGVRLAACI